MTAKTMSPMLPALTGQRFFAALAVVLYHFAAHFHLPAPLQNFVQNGLVGVSFFFVLSGFILAYSYAQPGLGMRGTIKEFNWARVARIYPVYLFALLLSLPPYYKTDFKGIGQALVDVGLSASLLQAWVPERAVAVNGPGWSLSTEFFLYLCFPLLLPWVQKLRRNASIRWVIGLWVAAFVPAALFQNLGLDIKAGLYFPLFHLPQFAIGVFAGWWFLHRPRTSLVQIAEDLTPWTLGAILILLMLPLPPLMLNNGLLAPLFALFFIGLASGGTGSRVLGNPLLLLLGGASYSMYILQMPIAAWFKFLSRYLNTTFDAPHLAAYIFVLIVFSILTFKYLENPAQKLVKQWSRRNLSSKDTAT